ncbi:YlbF family regulator [Brevibacillus marinus]|uniref:YlbF family regulator n=1 Tax=Brevibacillus marinus TaxID=2496837 RepID=UPI000F82E3DD|nr:YlbF family regulator [Brevibacillus marinus]
MNATETLDMTLMIDEAYTLAQMINDSREVAEYLAAKQRMEQDAEAQRLRRLFAQKKEQYEEVQRFGKYHPDFARVSEELRETKRALDQLESVRAFKKAEERLDEMLYEVSRTIADAVSPAIKVPSNNPFLEALSGGCGSGGSCGCGKQTRG